MMIATVQELPLVWWAALIAGCLALVAMGVIVCIMDRNDRKRPAGEQADVEEDNK